MPVKLRFSAPVQTDPGTHPASYTMGTGSLSRGQSGRVVALTTHSFQRRGLRNSRAILLLPLWAFVACSRATFTPTLE